MRYTDTNTFGVYEGALDVDTSWMQDAKCKTEGKDTDFFFPAKGEAKKLREAIAYCQSCPVKDQCLDWRLRTVVMHADDGVFGGTSGKERRDIRMQRYPGRRSA